MKKREGGGVNDELNYSQWSLYIWVSVLGRLP